MDSDVLPHGTPLATYFSERLTFEISETLPDGSVGPEGTATVQLRKEH